jgi:bacterial/archaeal transporter family protein
VTNQPLAWWVYALLAAVFAALTTLFQKLGVRGVPPNLATAIRTCVVLALAWGLVAARGELPALSSLTRSSLWFLILSGIATGLSWLAYFKALEIGPASSVAAVDKLSLALILVLAALFLNEPITLKSGAAVLLISAGTLLLVL